jgi:hypothetical protein
MAEPKYIIATTQNGRRFDEGFRYCVIGPFDSEKIEV